MTPQPFFKVSNPLPIKLEPHPAKALVAVVTLAVEEEEDDDNESTAAGGIGGCGLSEVCCALPAVDEVVEEEEVLTQVDNKEPTFLLNAARLAAPLPAVAAASGADEVVARGCDKEGEGLEGLD